MALLRLFDFFSNFYRLFLEATKTLRIYNFAAQFIQSTCQSGKDAHSCHVVEKL